MHLSGSQDAIISAAVKTNDESIARRREFERTSDDAVRKRVAAIAPDMLELFYLAFPLPGCQPRPYIHRQKHSYTDCHMYSILGI